MHTPRLGSADEVKRLLEYVENGDAHWISRVSASEAAAENARVNLSYTTLSSPITGRTGSVNLKRGNVVKSNDTTTQAVPLVTITQIRPIYVTFTVPERHLSDIRAAVGSSEHLPVVVAVPVSCALTPAMLSANAAVATANVIRWFISPST